MKFLGVIPARYESTRFPGKPLAEIQGKTMIQRVYEQAGKSQLDDICVATDDTRIYEHVRTFGHAIMTKSSHQSGTERCAEAALKIDGSFDFIVNIQGDEPFINPESINILLNQVSEETQISTLAVPIEDADTLFSPHSVKVIQAQNQGIYFSRSPIPYQRDIAKEDWLSKSSFLKHLGIYLYRKDVLRDIINLDPTPLEQAEKLEQLRWLENGYTINVYQTTHDSIGVDTPEDLQRIIDK